MSAALCYGLITYCNKFVSSLVVTASWPIQVRATPTFASSGPHHAPPQSSAGCSLGARVRGAQVFVTIVLSYFIFHIEMVTMEYIGMGMILVGMLFTVWGNYQEQQSERQGYQILSVNDAYKD